MLLSLEEVEEPADEEARPGGPVLSPLYIGDAVLGRFVDASLRNKLKSFPGEGMFSRRSEGIRVGSFLPSLGHSV